MSEKMDYYKKSLNHIVWADQTYDEYKYLISSLLTTIESQEKKIEIIKTAKERLLRYTRDCRKDRDGWQYRVIQQIEFQKEEIDNLLNWINQKMNSMTNLQAYSYDMGIYHGYKAVKEHIELGKEISK